LDDGTDDGTDGWKGRPPPDRLRILYKKIYSSDLDLTLPMALNCHDKKTQQTAPSHNKPIICSTYPFVFFLKFSRHSYYNNLKSVYSNLVFIAKILPKKRKFENGKNWRFLIVKSEGKN